jgi:hypothetical protein
LIALLRPQPLLNIWLLLAAGGVVIQAVAAVALVVIKQTLYP